MQINNVLSRHLEPRAQNNRGDLLQALGAATGQTPAARGAATTSASQAAAQILKQYDVTNITPQKFSEMLQKLYDAGALSKDELRQLSQIRLDLDSSGVSPDESIDLLEHYSEKLRQISKTLDNTEAQAAGERKALQQSADVTQHNLDWLQKFAALHSAPESMSIDAVA